MSKEEDDRINNEFRFSKLDLNGIGILVMVGISASVVIWGLVARVFE